ncbi:MAG: hypothetical protein ACEPOZ_09050 [Marinifilaceae bacterium]
MIIFREYDEGMNLFCIEMSGRIQLYEIMEFLDKILSDNSLPRQLRIIEDATSADFCFDIEDSWYVRELLEIQSKKFLSLRYAMLRETPMQTAYAMMLDYENNIKNCHTKVFFTKHGALQWLLCV